MSKLFLFAKNWQLLILIYGIPICYSIIISINSALFDIKEVNDLPILLKYNSIILPILMISLMTIPIGWLWSVSFGFKKMIPENDEINFRKLKTFLLAPLVILIPLMTFSFTEFYEVLIILVLWIVACISFIYSSYNVAKIL